MPGLAPLAPSESEQIPHCKHGYLKQELQITNYILVSSAFKEAIESIGTALRSAMLGSVLCSGIQDQDPCCSSQPSRVI